jgi:hypothetical protein
MAVRTPLYLNGSNLQEMTATQINQIVAQVQYLYSLDPSVTLSVVSSGGNLGSYTDTRLQAGSGRSFTTRYPNEGETAEPSTVTVTYSRVSQSVASTTQPADTSSVAFPAFVTSGNIQAMSATDVYDTFISPAITNLVSGSTGSAQGGTYFISSSSSVGGATLMSGTPVFSDTRANTGAYSAGEIYETLDQPTTISNFYLHRLNGAASSYTAPLFITSSGHLQAYSTGTFETLVQNFVKHAATSITGLRIRYSINSTGTNRGSGMTNTILNGAGNYQQRFVNADDYRAQEFPNGSAITAATHFLRIYST